MFDRRDRARFSDAGPTEHDAVASELGSEIRWRRQRNDGGHVHAIRQACTPGVGVKNLDRIGYFGACVLLLQVCEQSVEVYLRSGRGTGCLLRLGFLRSSLRGGLGGLMLRWDCGRRQRGDRSSAGRDFRLEAAAYQRRTDIANTLAVGG